jgi:hypothetical protein
MSINQRKHLRFSLDIPSSLVAKNGARSEIVLQQISIGGCYTHWHSHLYAGDEFRLEVEMPNGNKLPLRCKAIYRLENSGIGVRFLDISRFEQDLVAEVITSKLEEIGLPVIPDPFSRPSESFEQEDVPGLPRERNEILDEVMSSEG